MPWTDGPPRHATSHRDKELVRTTKKRQNTLRQDLLPSHNFLFPQWQSARHGDCRCDGETVAGSAGSPPSVCDDRNHCAELIVFSMPLHRPSSELPCQLEISQGRRSPLAEPICVRESGLQEVLRHVMQKADSGFGEFRDRQASFLAGPSSSSLALSSSSSSGFTFTI